MPSVEERAQRVDELLPLLASSNTPDVAFALRHLGWLKAAERAPAEELLWQLGPALSLPVKRHALSALEIAETILEDHPALAYVGLPVLVGALPNQKPEVQRRTLHVIERHRGALTELDRQRLLDLTPDLDRPLRELVSSVAGGPVAGPEPPSEAVAIPPRITRSHNTPCLHLFAKLERVRGAEDFLDRWERVLDHAWDAEEIELLLDASVRLDTPEIDHDRALSIFRRGPNTSFIFGVTEPLEALQYVIAARLDLPRQRHGVPSAGDSPLEAILTRVRELLEDRPYRGQLCTPTHRGGSIDALVAAERIAFLEAPAMPMDLAQMVLRLAPDHRSEALGIVEHVEGEEARILAYAIGAEVDAPALPGRLAPAWSAAEHARDPSGYEPWGAAPSDVAATAGRRVRELPRMGSLYPFGREPLPDVMPSSPAALLDLDNVWWHSYKPGTWEQWLATVWPARRSSQYRIVTRRLWDHNGYHYTDGIDRILGQLRHPREVVDGEATLALCITLSTDDVALRGLAAEIAHTLVLERRLDGNGIGEALVYLLRGHPDTDAERAHWQFTEHSFHLWRHSLADIAESSALGAHEIQIAIETLFANAKEQDRKRVAWLVPLLRHLVLEGDAAVVNPDARRFLEGFSRSSKTGRAAREMLAVTGSGAARSHAAVAAIEIPIDSNSTSDR